MASEEMRQAAELILSNGRIGDVELPPIDEMRADMEAQQAALTVPDDVTMTDLNMAGVPCRWVSTPESRAERILMYLHGGGYVMGSLDTHAELMGRLARVARCRVLGVDYRLAPEHPFPSAVEDSLAVYRALYRGSDGARIAIGGDSAGGGLTAATLIALKARGEQQPNAAVLFSPWTDLTGNSATYETRRAEDPMINPDVVGTMAAMYHGDTNPKDGLVSPIFGDLGGLAPMLVQVGDHEVLLDDSVVFAERVTSVGGTAELQVWEEAFHVFQALPQLPEAQEALQKVDEFLERYWS